ncbi:LptF/LptG family permease [bacterium]
MKILSKYMIREFIKPLAAAMCVFASLFVLSETFRIINITNKTPNAISYIPLYLLYKTPVWLIRILPMGILLAFLFSYSNLRKHNEVTAVKAGGININALFKPLIMFSFLISLIVLTGNATILPKLNEKASYFLTTKIFGQKMYLRTEYRNIIYNGREDRKYVIKRFDIKANLLEKVNIDGFDKKLNILEQIYAEKATWDGSKWIFENGIFRQFDPLKRLVIKEEAFTKKIIPIPEKPDDFRVEKKDDDDMTITEIKKYVDKLKRNSLPAHKKSAQMHLKIAFPFSNMIVILIGIAFASYNIKSNKLISFAISLVISFLYWGMLSVGISLGKNRVLPPFLAAWITNFIFIGVGTYFIRKLKR